MPGQPIALTSGELRIADGMNLENEISRLWQSAAADPGVRQNLIRASVLTLLAYTESETFGADTQKRIEEVTYENPCRAVVMVAERAAAAEGLRASISAHCSMSGQGEKQVCCEIIYIHASGKTVEGLKSVVVPLVIPELPVYLWWRVNRFSPPEYMADILRISDRVLVDSSTFLDPARDLAELGQQVRRSWGGRRLAFSDLNWARITPWRELLANCFDFPQSKDCLRGITQVTIRWAADSEASTAFMLAAWLVGRLGWQPRESRALDAHGWVFNLNAKGTPVQILCQGMTQGRPNASPLSVSIAVEGDPQGTFQFEQSNDSKTVVAHCALTGRTTFSRTVHYPPPSISRLICNELRFPSHDAIYEEILGALSSLMG